MTDCPKSIDGAVVILAMRLERSRHRHTGRTRLIADGEEQTWFHGLAIARYGRDAVAEDIYLFHCDEDWQTQNDTDCASIEAAIEEASEQFCVSREDWRPVSWPFDQTPDTACITTKPAIQDGLPILFAQHFEDDHSWVFTCGTTNAPGDCMVIGMGEAVQHDQSIVTISDLPPGWSAERNTTDSPWIARKSEE